MLESDARPPDAAASTSVVERLEATVTEQAREIETLRRALETSRRIGAAMGIVMAMHKVTVDEAFSVLVRISQNTNRKLHVVADDLVSTGELPADPSARGETLSPGNDS